MREGCSLDSEAVVLGLGGGGEGAAVVVGGLREGFLACFPLVEMNVLFSTPLRGSL